MHAGTWADVAAQSIVHGIVFAVAVGALIKLWRVESAAERLALRLLAVVEPLVVSPALVLAFPSRSADEFRERFAVFTARHWEDVQVAGVPLFAVWLGFMAAAALALLVMDLRPLVLARGRGLAGGAPPPGIDRTVCALAAQLRVKPPPVRFVDSDAPVLYCTGIRTPQIVVSRGTLALLDAEELEAALAHEIAHLSARDPTTSWSLMAVRIVLFFNPAVQVVGRLMTRDAEARADERAAQAADRVVLASALLKLFRATFRPGGIAVPRTLPFAAALAEPFRRARTLDVEVRCRRLLAPPARLDRTLAAARFALAAGAVLLLATVIA